MALPFLEKVALYRALLRGKMCRCRILLPILQSRAIAPIKDSNALSARIVGVACSAAPACVSVARLPCRGIAFFGALPPPEQIRSAGSASKAQKSAPCHRKASQRAARSFWDSFLLRATSTS